MGGRERNLKEKTLIRKMSAPKTDFTMEEVRDFIDNELPTYLDQQ